MTFTEAVYDLVIQTGIVSLSTLIVLSPYLFLSIGRKFDALFGKVNLCGIEQGIFFISKFWRIHCYMLCIIHPKAPMLTRGKTDPYFWNWFGDYNFRENASTLQIIVSYLYFFMGLFVFIPGGILFFILDFFIM